MQTDSELESDTSSINDGVTSGSTNNLPLSREQLDKRISSLLQENRVYKIEIDTFKLRIKALQEENKDLRKASVNIQARAEQEEEYISNKLLKKIQSLKKEKETLANNYEREEEYLTNDLSRKLNQLRNEKVQLEQTLEQEQEHMVNKLMRKIEKLEAETSAKQTNLEQLRREKIELENTLEQEQESLVNRLWKRMEKLEAEKRHLQEKLEQPVSAPMSPRTLLPSNTVPTNMPMTGTSTNTNMPSALNLPHGFPAPSEQATNLTEHIINLRREVSRLKTNLEKSERDHKEKISKVIREEKTIKDENVRLQRRLQMEVDRREALCRHLSESESSLEMDDERHFNESSRVRTVSSPIPGFLVGSTGVSSSSSHINAASSNNTTTAQNITCSNTNPNQNIACSAPLSNLITMQPVSTTVERCPTCNQLKTLNISSNTPQNVGLVNTTSPQSYMNMTGSKGQVPPCPLYNPLTASSSLSSSTSSINSSNKQLQQTQQSQQHHPQHQPINIPIHDKKF